MQIIAGMFKTDVPGVRARLSTLKADAVRPNRVRDVYPLPVIGHERATNSGVLIARWDDASIGTILEYTNESLVALTSP